MRKTPEIAHLDLQKVDEPCASCKGKCCRLFVVSTTIADVLRIMDVLDVSPSDFVTARKASGVNYALEQPVFLPDENGKVGEYLMCLKRRGDGACIFHAEDGRCVVHGFAPRACQSYPFLFDDSGRVGYIKRFVCRRKWLASEQDTARQRAITSWLQNELKKTAVITRRWNAEFARGGDFNKFLKFAISEARKG